MWTEITREQYRREGLRYASDMTDAEWAMVEPFMPAVKWLGRPRKVDLRGVVEGLLYILRTACPWRLLPHDFPNRSTVQRYFYAWQTDGLWERINFVLLQQAREQAGREASPSGGVIDSQSVKTTESGGPRGDDAGKKVNGRKRHIITDTTGLLVGAQVHGRRHPGSGRRGRRAGFDPLSLPLAAPRLRRWRLCWQKAGDDPRRDGAVEACHRQATGSGQRLLPASPALGGRANLRLAWPQPAAGKRLRGDDRQRRGMALSGIGPALGAPSCTVRIPYTQDLQLLRFLVRLLDVMGTDERIPVPLTELNDLKFLLMPSHSVAPVGRWLRSRWTLVWRSPQFLRAAGACRLRSRSARCRRPHLRDDAEPHSARDGLCAGDGAPYAPIRHDRRAAGGGRGGDPGMGIAQPGGMRKKPLTIDEVLSARMVSYPYTVRDCCPITDGGGAVIMTTAERAPSLKKPPVYVLGCGQAITHADIRACRI
jgi:transposase